jgi:hypothetical protein
MKDPVIEKQIKEIAKNMSVKDMEKARAEIALRWRSEGWTPEKAKEYFDKGVIEEPPK